MWTTIKYYDIFYVRNTRTHNVYSIPTETYDERDTIIMFTEVRK